MTAIITRAGKGSPLLNSEVDANFNNLNSGKVEKVGDTVSGSINFSGSAGVARYHGFQTNGSQRWFFGASGSTESGGNAGSDFIVARYADNGAWIDTPFSIIRSTGQMALTVRPQWGGGLTPFDSGNLAGTAVTWTAQQTLTNGGVNGNDVTPALSAAAGKFRYISYNTNGTFRWAEGVSSTAESGSNAGSDWFLNRYDDTGAYLGKALGITRSTGVISLGGPLDLGSNRISNITDPSSAQDAVTLNFLNNNTFGWRNRIINGDARVQQRTQVSVGTSNTYSTADRFYSAIGGGAGGSAVLGTNSMTVSGISRACLALISTTPPSSIASGAWWYAFNQVIEGYNSYDLVGKPLTVSFWWQSNVTGLFSISIRDSASAYSFVQSFNYTAANTPQFFTIQVPAIPAAATIPESTGVGLQVSIGSLNTGTYQCPTANLGAWQNANYISAQGAVNWAATANNFVRMAELQIEAGTIATPFERRPLSTELALCQRYYEAGDIAPLYQSGLSTAAMMFPFYYKASKRVAPTVSFANISYYSGGTPTAISSGYSAVGGGLVMSSLYINSGTTNMSGLAAGNYVANSEF